MSAHTRARPRVPTTLASTTPSVLRTRPPERGSIVKEYKEIVNPDEYVTEHCEDAAWRHWLTAFHEKLKVRVFPLKTLLAIILFINKVTSVPLASFGMLYRRYKAQLTRVI